MKLLRKLAIGAALVAGSSALAVAQPEDHRDGRAENRDHGRNYDRDRGNRDGRHFDRDRDNRRFYGDRDDWRFRDRDDRRYYVRTRPVYGYNSYYVGEQRYFNGYNWTWDGDRWCRHDRGLTFYFNF
jgi:hypothetical protein